MKRPRKREQVTPRHSAQIHSMGASAASRQLPVLLHRTREALAVHFRKIFLQHDLTDPQWRVLRLLAQVEEIDVSNLAQRSYLMRTSLSRILRDLAARELIVRRTSSTDGRRFFHALTFKGRRLIDEVSPSFNPVYKEIESRFGIGRIEDLNKRLTDLLAAIQIVSDEPFAPDE
jgi:homoprotocatechuate degradation regulator HpaR